MMTWEEFVVVAQFLAKELRLTRAAQWHFDACPMWYELEGGCVARVNGLTHPAGVSV